MDQVDYFADYNSNLYRDTANVLQEYKDKLSWKDNEHVLDIGCGPGNSTAELLIPAVPPTTHVTGCDVSVKMIKYAQKKFESDRLKFTAVDICDDNAAASLGIEAYDKIFSFYCMHWVSDERKAYANMSKLLKPNGVILLIILRRTPLQILYEMLRKDSRFAEYMQDEDRLAVTPYAKEKDPSKVFGEMMKAAGFKILEYQEKCVPVLSPSVEEHTKSLRGVNPFISKMPENLQREYMDAIGHTMVDSKLVIVNRVNGQEQLAIAPNEIIVAYCQKIKT